MKKLDEMVVEAARKKAESEKLVLPFSYHSLNTAYVLLRDQYSAHEELCVPDKLLAEVDEDCPKEMAEAEASLHSFMGTLIEYSWGKKPVEISMIATGRCQIHPNEDQTFRKLLSKEAVGKIITPDYVLTSETIGRCREHSNEKLFADVSQLEYRLDAPSESDNGVLKFQSRIKRTSMIDKLTRGIIGDKPYALDFRGGRIICKDFEAYVKVCDYLIGRIERNGNIHMIPIAGALEEHVAETRDSSTYLSKLLSRNDLHVKKEPHYESLHLLIRYLGMPIELQCRDISMHEEAEKGLAAHKDYKEKELQDLMMKYPDFCNTHAIVKDTYKALMPSDLKLFPGSVLPLEHN